MHLKQRISYEKKRLYIPIINTSILCLAFLLAMPLLAFNPIIPLTGALVAVIVTIVCYGAGKWVEKQKPVDKISYVEKKQPSVVSQGFFKPTTIPDNKPITSSSVQSLPPNNLICCK